MYLVKHIGNLIDSFTNGDHLLSDNRRFLNNNDKAAIKTAKSLAKDCKGFPSNKNLCITKNFKMRIVYI